MSTTTGFVNTNIDRNSKLQHALAWAARGFKVFPVKEGSKLPLFKDWTDLATTDEGQIRKWWTCGVTGIEHGHNIGCSATDWIVADLDTKEGKRGLESFESLGLGLTTLTVRTPSGGLHAYFSCLARLSQLGPQTSDFQVFFG
jgi:hypothetical protein